LLAKFPIFPKLKHLKGNFPLYFPYPFLSFLINLASSSFDISKWFSFGTCLCFLISFDSLKVVSLFDDFYFLVLSSYAIRIPRSSSIVRLSRSSQYSKVYMLASYLIGNDLNTFWTIILSFNASPNVMIEMTISSTL
jgi:hypothetical protein